MNINLVGTIPCKRHLKKYLYYIENVKDGGALNLKNNSSFSYFLSNLLEKKIDVIDDEHHSFNTNSPTYNAKIRFKITTKMKKLNCFFLARKSILMINRYLHRKFVDYLTLEVIKGARKQRSQREVIVEIMEEMDIVLDIEYDALKKAVDRSRLRKKYENLWEQRRRKEKEACR